MKLKAMDKKFVKTPRGISLSPSFTCKTCLKPATIPLRNKERKKFASYKKGFNCPSCAIKFWEPKIASGEVNLAHKSPNFRQDYEMAKKSHHGENL